MSRYISQEVCPWNGPKLVQLTTEQDYLPRVPGLSGRAVLRDAREDEEPLVREHAAWALNRLASRT